MNRPLYEMDPNVSTVDYMHKFMTLSLLADEVKQYHPHRAASSMFMCCEAYFALICQRFLTDEQREELNAKIDSDLVALGEEMEKSNHD